MQGAECGGRYFNQQCRHSAFRQIGAYRTRCDRAHNGHSLYNADEVVPIVRCRHVRTRIGQHIDNVVDDQVDALSDHVAVRLDEGSARQFRAVVVV